MIGHRMVDMLFWGGEGGGLSTIEQFCMERRVKITSIPPLCGVLQGLEAHNLLQSHWEGRGGQEGGLGK